MNNLILAVIAIAFSALIMTAGISYLTPNHAVLNTEASATAAQLQQMFADYNTLKMNVGHTPSAADYQAVFGAGNFQTANLSYSQNGTTVEHDVNIGTANHGAVLQLEFAQGPSCPTGSNTCFIYHVQNSAQMSAPDIATTCRVLTMVENRMRTDSTHSYFTPPAELHCA